MKRNHTRIIKTTLLILGIIVLLRFIATAETEQLWQELTKIGAINVFILLIPTIANIFIKALRWKMIIGKVARKKISTKFSFYSIIAGVAGGSFIPGRFDLAKPLMLKASYNVKISKSILGLFLDRTLDLIALLAILLAGIYLIPKQNLISNYAVIGFISLITIPIVLILIFPKKCKSAIYPIIAKMPLPKKLKIILTNLARESLEAILILKSKRVLFSLVFLSFVANFLEIIRFYWLLQLFKIDVTLGLTGFVFSSAIIIGALTTIPGGIGITETSAAGILAGLIKESNLALIKRAILFERIISYYLLIVLGSFILISQSNFRKEKQC